MGRFRYVRFGLPTPALECTYGRALDGPCLASEGLTVQKQPAVPWLAVTRLCPRAALGTALVKRFYTWPRSKQTARAQFSQTVLLSPVPCAFLQLTAIDGRRATVVLPNDPDLVDILAKNGVDISVSEGDQQGNYVALLGNILFPLIAFGGLFFLFRRAQVRREGCSWCGGCRGQGRHHEVCAAQSMRVTCKVVSLTTQPFAHQLSPHAAASVCLPACLCCRVVAAATPWALWVAPWSLAAASPSSRRCQRLA